MHSVAKYTLLVVALINVINSEMTKTFNSKCGGEATGDKWLSVKLQKLDGYQIARLSESLYQWYYTNQYKKLIYSEGFSGSDAALMNLNLV